MAQFTQPVENEWVPFQGGELEGERPKAYCPECRKRLAAGHLVFKPRTLCFQCYRAELDRQRALQAAGQLDTASEERFQAALPFAPVNQRRLERLRHERDRSRSAARTGVGRFVDKRRQAQIAARHALERLAAGLEVRELSSVERDRLRFAAIHAAELQLPESWLRFVVAR